MRADTAGARTSDGVAAQSTGTQAHKSQSTACSASLRMPSNGMFSPSMAASACATDSTSRVSASGEAIERGGSVSLSSASSAAAAERRAMHAGVPHFALLWSAL